MAWPTDYDTFTAPGSTLDTPPHSTLHTQTNTALTVLQQTLGLSPQAGFATVDARLDDLTLAAAGTGTWASYSPETSNVSTGVGGIVARYRRTQQYTVEVRLEFNFGAGSAITGVVSAKVPLAPKTGSVQAGTFTVIRFGLTPRSGGVYLTDDRVLKFVYDSNTSGLWDASGPTTGTNGDQLIAHITYETQAAV